MTNETRGWKNGLTVAFFFKTGVSKVCDWRIEELKNCKWLMKLVVGRTGLQLHSFLKQVSVVLKNWRIEGLEMSDEARGWKHGPTVAFFF